MRHSGSGSRGRCDSARPQAGQMRQQARAEVEIRDVAAGLWLWRTEHPHWRPGVDWELVVASTCVESGGEVLLLDPLAPPDDATEVWERLDARRAPPGAGVKADHVRDVDTVVRR